MKSFTIVVEVMDDITESQLRSALDIMFKDQPITLARESFKHSSDAHYEEMLKQHEDEDNDPTLDAFTARY